MGRSSANDIQVDLAKGPPTLSQSFDWVIHNAGKAHIVPKTEEEKAAFFQVNHLGTINLLKALDIFSVKPKQFILISTVAVYGLDSGEGIEETQDLAGHTPYAQSKILAEEVVMEWCQRHQVDGVILRLPLVVDSNPPGNLGAIMRAIQRGYYFSIGKNEARKSVVLAIDVARLIPKLEGKSGIFNLADGQHPTFAAIESAIADGLGKSIAFTLPNGLVKLLAKIGDGICTLGIAFPFHSDRLAKMTATLTFNDEKARRELGWAPGAVTAYLRNMDAAQREEQR